MKKAFTFIVVLLVIATMIVTQSPIARAQAKTTITITLVNNPDQRKLIELSSQFTAAYPNIDVSFVTLPENELRDRLTTDISTGTGSFDIAQIGTYDTPIFAKNGQLAALRLGCSGGLVFVFGLHGLSLLLFVLGIINTEAQANPLAGRHHAICS